MRAKMKKTTLKTRALTDPQPQFVSLVTAAATMTPFAVTKMEQTEGTEAMGKALKKKTDDSALATVRKMEGYQISEIAFPKGDAFPDEAAVKTWLEESGYDLDGLTAKKGENDEVTGWAVKSAESFDETQTVEIDGGVSVVVGKVKEDASDEAAAKGEIAPLADAKDDAETAAKEDEPVKPVATEAAAKTDDAPKADEAEAAAKADAGTEEVAQKSIYSVTYLADTIRCLTWLASDVAWEEDLEGAPADMSVKLKTLASEALLLLADMATTEAEQIKKSEGDATDKTETAKTDVQPSLEEIVKAVVTPLAEAMTALTKSVSEIAAMSEASSVEIGQRVEALENRAQTRKGAEVEETNAPATETKSTKTADAEDDEKFIRNLSRRSAIGMSR